MRRKHDVSHMKNFRRALHFHHPSVPAVKNSVWGIGKFFLFGIIGAGVASLVKHLFFFSVNDGEKALVWNPHRTYIREEDQEGWYRKSPSDRVIKVRTSPSLDAHIDFGSNFFFPFHFGFRDIFPWEEFGDEIQKLEKECKALSRIDEKNEPPITNVDDDDHNQGEMGNDNYTVISYNSTSHPSVVKIEYKSDGKKSEIISTEAFHDDHRPSSSSSSSSPSSPSDRYSKSIPITYHKQFSSPKHESPTDHSSKYNRSTTTTANLNHDSDSDNYDDRSEASPPDSSPPSSSPSWVSTIKTIHKKCE